MAANGEATWSVQDLGVGSWVLSVDSEGFETASIPFDVTGDGGARRLRVELVPESIPATESTGGCSTRSGGAVPSPVLWIVAGFGLALMRSRRHCHA